MLHGSVGGQRECEQKNSDTDVLLPKVIRCRQRIFSIEIPRRPKNERRMPAIMHTTRREQPHIQTKYRNAIQNLLVEQNRKDGCSIGIQVESSKEESKAVSW